MKNKGSFPKSTIKTKKEIREARYEYAIDNNIKYLGSLYENYKNTKAKIKNRNCKGLCNYYEIEFEDGRIMNVKETWISKWEEPENEN